MIDVSQGLSVQINRSLNFKAQARILQPILACFVGTPHEMRWMNHCVAVMSLHPNIGTEGDAIHFEQVSITLAISFAIIFTGKI